MKPIAVIFKSSARVMANVVGADFERMIPTPIFAALINISDDIRPLKMSTLSRIGIYSVKRSAK